MPEAVRGESAAGADAGVSAAAATGEPRGVASSELRAASDGVGEPADPTRPAEHRFFYGLGIGVQTLLWFLLFLAIVVAVAVGGELTEFRYVGF
ncbi:MAG: hypothetical protein JW767_01060 [Thermoleophilia bacterium]|nr:hypothetical protein [Thermoleophilia bacterium]